MRRFPLRPDGADSLLAGISVYEGTHSRFERRASRLAGWSLHEDCRGGAGMVQAGQASGYELVSEGRLATYAHGFGCRPLSRQSFGRPGRVAGTRRHHQPFRRAHTSTAADMTPMIASRITSETTWVCVLTMTFIPRTDERAVTGRVI